jgi:hypothetical protein
MTQRQARLNRRFGVGRVKSPILCRMLEYIHVDMKCFLHLRDRSFDIQEQSIGMRLNHAQPVQLGEGAGRRIIFLCRTKTLGEFCRFQELMEFRAGGVVKVAIQAPDADDSFRPARQVALALPQPVGCVRESHVFPVKRHSG